MTNQEDIQVMYDKFEVKYYECLHSARGSKARGSLGYYNDLMNWCVRLGAVEMSDDEEEIYTGAYPEGTSCAGSQMP